MLKSSSDFIVFIGGNRADIHNYITEVHAASRKHALRIARKFARKFPAHNITIEEWFLVTSHNPFFNGLYKGEVIRFTAQRKEVVA